MKWWIYNALFTVAYLAMMPAFLLRMKRRGGYRARMGDRFGFYPPFFLPPPKSKVQSPKVVRRRLTTNDQRPMTNDHFPIWIHAVSVGEVQVAGQLMRAMRAKDPSVRFVFSTTSSTGWKMAEKEVGPGDVLIYNPLDFRWCVRRALDRVNPRAVILTETEIWPNFIRAVRRRGIPLYLVNARVSDRSAPRYRALRWFFGEVLRCFTKIYVQSDLDAQRLIAAGAAPSSLETTGSLKFDVARRNPAKEAELSAWLNLQRPKSPIQSPKSKVQSPASNVQSPILLGGSTWPGEDEVLLEIYSELIKTHPEVKLVIAPRHFEKADAVEANIVRSGFACIRRSRPTQSEVQSPESKVYLCDTTGEMMGLFGICTVAFVGKSLCAHGSQNMIEPCLCGKPTLVGPYTENFRPVMSDLLSADAIVQVPDKEALRDGILRFFDDPVAREEQGKRATAAVTRRCGVTDRCAAELLASIPDAPPPRPPFFTRRRCIALGALAILYLAGAWFATPFVNHGWNYLRLDVKRSYASFIGLSAATVCCPWCWPAARKACSGLLDREVLATDEFGVTRFDVSPRLAKLIPRLFPNSECVAIDARRLTRAEFAQRLSSYDGKGYRLWCVGRWDYVVEAGETPVTVDGFCARFDGLFKEFSAAGVYRPADLLACYVGNGREISPAFADCGLSDRILSKLPLRLAFQPPPQGGCAGVRVERFTPLEAPDFSWISRGKAMGRIYIDFMDRVLDVQKSRRDILLGFVAQQEGKAEKAVESWAGAAKVNRCDPLLANLVSALDLDARRYIALGNVNGAMRCYENRLLILPKDAAAVHNFGVCLKKSGHFDAAVGVFARAVQLAPQEDEHRLQLIEAAAATHHAELACAHLEALIRRHPRDPALKLRAARLLCLEENPSRDPARAVKLAEEAVKLVKGRKRAYVLGLANVYVACGRAAEGVALKRQMKTMIFDRDDAPAETEK